MNKRALLEGVDYFIYFMKMPPKIYAFVSPNNDGTWSIYLDPRRDKPHRIKDLNHELKHIYRGDFYSIRSVYELENEM